MHDQRIHTGSLELQIWDYPHPGSPIVFLHFGGGNLMMWQRAVPFFQERHRLLLVDLRDHGHSDKPQSGDDIDQMAQDVAGVLDALAIEKAHVIGSSLGAEVGLSLAAHFPAKVISLVCDGASSSEFGPYSAWTDSAEAFQQHADEILAGIAARPVKRFPTVQAFVADRQEALEKHGLWNEYMAALQEYDAFEALPGEFTRSWQKQAALNYMTRYFACRFEDYYRRVECPLLMVTGPENDPAETRAMQGLCALARSAQIAVVPGWMHPYGWLFHPDEMCHTILDFLSQVDRKQPAS